MLKRRGLAHEDDIGVDQVVQTRFQEFKNHFLRTRKYRIRAMSRNDTSSTHLLLVSVAAILEEGLSACRRDRKAVA
jgi:hypothetical protein